jgi:hypothetical protein
MRSHDSVSAFARAAKTAVVRRRSARHRSKARLIGKLRLVETGESLDVRVGDLSEKGLRLTASKKVEPGSPAVLNMKKNTAVKGMNLALKVIYANLAGESWQVGCEFNEPLAPVLLDYLVR